MGFPKKILPLLLLSGLALCLLQVWLPGYYLTGDGPCHLYNAQIVHDIWCGRNTEFYSRFYSLAYNPDPNWLSTFALALLLFVAKGVIAEKIFLTLYVLLYISGFYMLLKKIGSKGSYWLLALFLFVFPLTLAKGFYNYSLSIAFYFWMVWGWLRLLERRSAGNALLFFHFTALIFFTHLLPFVFGVFTCGALAASYALAGAGTGKPAAYFFKQAGLLLLLAAPFLALMALFTHKEGGLQLQLSPHPYRLLELVQLKYLITLANTEKLPAAIAGCCLLVLCIIALVKVFPRFAIHRYDGFVASLLFVTLVYFFFPEDFLGRVIIISIRAQLFVCILAVCCLACRPPQAKVLHAGAFVLFGCFIVLSIQRIQCRQIASTALAAHLQVSSLLKPGSVVLPLSFSREGRNARGEMIADRNSVFQHASDYLGLDKPLIILDNYEANMGYFPLSWKDSVNPYFHLSTGTGIEGMPPGASIAGYKQAAGVDVDYIIMWCYDPAYLAVPAFSALYKEINSGYHLVATSSGNTTLLYQRK